MNTLTAEELSIEATVVNDGALRLDWKGKSNARDPWTVVGDFFKDVVTSASKDGRLVEMHFEELEYFNSSTITAVIRVMRMLREADIKLTVVFDEGLRWQKLSFDGLRIFQKPDGYLTFATLDR